MKAYLAGSFILAAAIYFTGCTSHPKAAQVREAHPQKRPSRPHLTQAQRDSAWAAQQARVAARRLAHSSKIRIIPVPRDTIRDTVYIREIPKPKRYHARHATRCPEGCERKSK